MSNTKCPNCGLYNFAGVTECRRCQQPFAYAPTQAPMWPQPEPVSPFPAAPDTTPYAAIPDTMPYAAIADQQTPFPIASAPAAQSFPTPTAWRPVATYDVDEIETAKPNHIPTLVLTFFLSAIMLVCAGFPPKLENSQYSLLTFHICMSAIIFFGVCKWLITKVQSSEETYYSGEIDGFLSLPATGMIIYFMTTAWMSSECRALVSKMDEVSKKINVMDMRTKIMTGAFQQSEQLYKAKEMLEFAWPCLLVTALLFFIAIIFFYCRHKRAPLICIIAMLAQIGFTVLLALRSGDLNRGALAASGGSSPIENFAWLDLLLMAGALCMLINFAAFILYFMVSKRVKATFV